MRHAFSHFYLQNWGNLEIFTMFLATNFGREVLADIFVQKFLRFPV